MTVWVQIVIINTPPLCFNADDDTRLFVAFQYNVNIDGQLQRIMGWGNSDLIFLLKSGDKNMFFDATFSITPKGFYQCLILMIYEPGTNLFILKFFFTRQGPFWGLGTVLGTPKNCRCGLYWVYMSHWTYG